MASPGAAWGSRRGGEGYYASITDMLVGVLFLFIVLLMYFALQLRDTTDLTIDTSMTRSQLLRQVSQRMAARGVPVEAVHEEGVLRFSDAALFEQGSNAPSEEGARALAVLAEALSHYAPCYAFTESAAAPPTHCTRPRHRLKRIVVEGHTDSDPPAGAEDNWDLSAARAAAAYRRMMAAEPSLAELRNGRSDRADAQSLFAIAGYAEQRPIALGGSAEAKARNRRVDVLFEMDPFSIETVETPPPREFIPEREVLPLRVDKTVRLRSGAKLGGVLGVGWSPPESWGVWAQASEATLRVRIAQTDRGKPLSLQLQGVAFLAEQAPKRDLDVLIAGKPYESWSFSEPERRFTRTLVLPAAITSAEEVIEIRFRMRNPQSPRALGLSSDPRTLSIALTSVRLKREVR